MSNVERKLQEMGLALPEVPKPMGFYKPVNRYGSLVYTSGMGSTGYLGKVGGDFSLEEGQKAAQACILACLAAIKSEIGNLDYIDKVFKVLGWVNSAPGFNQQPLVINGASQILIELFGENGRHARSAIGANELPNDVAVEIEILVGIKNN